MFKEFFAVLPNFLDEDQRNKIVADDYLLKGKNSLPPKSDLGREVKEAVTKVSADYEWYFQFDRVEYIRILYSPYGNAPNNTPVMALLEPSGKGIQQRQRKFNCFVKLTDVHEGSSHLSIDGSIEIVNPTNSRISFLSNEISRPGDLIVLPSYVSYHIYPDVGSGNTLWLNIMLEGLSFR